MASTGGITVKVTPDLSAFRQMAAEEIAEFLAGYVTYPNDAESAATALVEHFTILPK